ncbi:MAG: gamma-glutamylcyclotransferase [Methylobacterium mesophilicum]|nr:gamma-glutamylcyclotransferase [Methylobacterium mesophilicum]
MTLLFVFGTLKRGFPLHSAIDGARYLGLCQTVSPFPMMVAGHVYGPMMLDRPGRGLRIGGELYEAGGGVVASVEKAENNGDPGNYCRPIEVRMTGGLVLRALACFKDARLARPRHSGYLAHYQDRRFICPKERSPSMPPLRLLSRSG